MCVRVCIYMVGVGRATTSQDNRIEISTFKLLAVLWQHYIQTEWQVIAAVAALLLPRQEILELECERVSSALVIVLTTIETNRWNDTKHGICVRQQQGFCWVGLE